MRRYFLAVSAVVLALTAALLVWLLTSDFVEIDTCLDAGGAWNAQSRTCRGLS